MNGWDMYGQGTVLAHDAGHGRVVDMTRRLGVVLVALVVTFMGLVSGTGQAHAASGTVRVMHPCDIDGDRQITGDLGKLCRKVWRQAAFSVKINGVPTAVGSGPNRVTRLRDKMDAEDWGPIQFREALQDVRDQFNRRQNPTAWQARAFEDPLTYGPGLHPADTDDADGILATDTELLAGKVWKQPQFQTRNASGKVIARYGSGPWAVTNASDAWGRGAITERQYIAYLKKYRAAYLSTK